MAPEEKLAFTVTFPEIVDELRIPVKVAKPGVPVEKAKKFEAIWDTGATKTLISQKLLTQLHLNDVIDKVDVISVEGKAKEKANAYYVDVWLPDSICFPGIKVVYKESFVGGDLLIGMDIIGSGACCVTNENDKTTLTFKRPSQCRYDFAEEIKAAKKKSRKSV